MRLLPVLALLLASSAFAAEIRVEGDTLFLDGEITKDDLGTFSGLLAASPEVKRVSLNSPGGDLATGLKMGEMVRARKLATYVEGGVREAASAAAYLFMGGEERIVKGTRGVGVHAFYTPEAELRKMIKQKSGDDLLKTLNEFERRTQEGTVAVVEYVMKMTGDTRIVSEAVKTGSDAMVWPGSKALLDMKVATKVVELTPEEVPDPDWAYGEVVAGLAAWLAPGQAADGGEALDETARQLLETFLADNERATRHRGDVESVLGKVAPANRDVARSKVVAPIVNGIVQQCRMASQKAAEAAPDGAAPQR